MLYYNQTRRNFMKLLIIYNLYLFSSLAISNIGLEASSSILENLIFINSMLVILFLLFFGNGIVTWNILIHYKKRKFLLVDAVLSLILSSIIYLITFNLFLIQLVFFQKIFAYIIYGVYTTLKNNNQSAQKNVIFSIFLLYLS